MILACQNIGKSYGERQLFRDVSFEVNAQEKLAIVGENGCGKSTLLKIIVGEERPDEGQVSFAKNVNFGYLAQYQDDVLKGTIHDYVLHAREDILSMEEKLTRLEGQMSESNAEEYHSLVHSYDLLGGYSYRSEVVGVLKGLGFSEEEFLKPVTQLSGGQKTRVSLARLLMKKPDLLLLDEPINHLDLHAIEWLETFLLNYTGAVLIVAHDRYFLDRTVRRIIDLSEEKARSYEGNYTSYVQQKEIYRTALFHAFEKQQKKIAHEEAVIEKLQRYNREKSIRRAESRKKKLDKIERMEKPREEENSMTISLSALTRSGKDVLQVEGLAKAYQERELFSDLSFQIRRGERVALIGENGIGKSTILKIISGHLEADAGKVRLGTGVTVGYYDQEQQLFDEEKTLFSEMQDSYPDLNDTRVRNVLAAFLFSGDDVYKQIKDLSGGERGRISLAKLMLSGSNFLLLDEPTNHLDMVSKEILENALKSYDGTLLFVSHDRYFVNQTAERILELTDSGMTEYLGNYDYYVEKRETIKKTPVAYVEKESDKGTVSQSSKEDWKEKKRQNAALRKRENERTAIESEIEKLEEEQKEIEAEYGKPEVATNSARLAELSAQEREISDQLEVLYEKWESYVS